MMRALILIDIQVGMDSPLCGARNNPDAEKNAARLLSFFRRQVAPIVHIRHFSTNPQSPLHPDNGGSALKDIVAPIAGELVFSKTTNSAFIGTPLEAHLRNIGAGGVVIAGLSTPHCVSTTTRMAANLGFEAWLAHDACAAFETHAGYSWSATAPRLSAQQIHDSEVSILHGEFCQAKTTDSILKDLA